jgi:hypothetical protein
MVALNQTFTRNELPDPTSGGGGVLIDPGTYKSVIVSSELKENSKKTGSYLELKFVLTEGQYANTEFFERLNLDNPNPQAVEIAKKKLAEIMDAVGVEQVADSNDLHNKPLMLEIYTKKQDDWQNDKGETVEGKDRSEIKKYLPVPAVGGAGAPTPQAANSAPPFPAATNNQGNPGF